MVFTVEEEDPRAKTINFLDVTITRTDTGFTYEFYQKETHSGRSRGAYLHFMSHGPIKTKLNIIASETRRVLENCSDTQRAYHHLETIRKNFVRAAYPEDLVVKKMIQDRDGAIPQTGQ